MTRVVLIVGFIVAFSAGLVCGLAVRGHEVQASPAATSRPTTPGGPGGLPLQALNLTEAQQDQIKQLTQQSRQQNQNVGEQLRSAMEAQRKAVETIPVDEGLIRSTTQALVDTQTEMAIHQARLRSEIFTVLTPDQQAQVRKLQAERNQRAQQPRQRGQQRQKQGQ